MCVLSPSRVVLLNCDHIRSIMVVSNCRIVCYRLHSRLGKLLNQVNIPSLNTTSVCFGGADLSTLFVTSAGKHNVPEGLNEPNGGNTFAVTDLGTKGRLAVSFAG